jgi:ligand-binding sensor domain-containing protein
MSLPHQTKILSIFLLICFGIEASAQNESLRFEHIGVEQGLSSNAVTCMLQDSKGYIWIGTEDGGLDKYDGYSFTRYTFDPLDSNSVSQNLIYTIWEDKEGFIWTSTYEGLCKFDRKTEKFTRYKPDPKSKFSDPNITSINEDNNGTMWIGGASGQLCRFDKKTGKFYDESFDLGFRKGPGEAHVHDDIACIYKDKEGILWVGNSTGLHEIEPAKPGLASQVKIIHYFPDPGNPNSLSSNEVYSVFEDHAGILWIATDNGLNSFDKKTNQFKHYLLDLRNINSISSISAGNWGNTNFAEDPAGNLWIITSNGLAELNKDRTQFRVDNSLSDTNSLNPPDVVHHFAGQNLVSAVLIDRSAILWVGSNAGLNKASLNEKPFGLKQHEPGNPNSLTDNKVTALLEDSSGNIWIGTDVGGLNYWNKKTNKFSSYRHHDNNPASLRYDDVYAMLEDHDGDLWICNGDVLSLLNRKTGQFTHYNSNAARYTDFDHFAIYSITEDAEGLIWLGTGNGIKSFDKKTKTFKHYYHNPADPSGISDYTGQTIFADSKDNIWIGYGSIATDRLDKKTGRITHYKHDSHDPSSISSNIVNSFFEDSKGNLWLATTSGGLCKFDYSTGTFTTYTQKDGLPDNTVFSILEDKKNNLWLGTRNGLTCFDPVKKTCINYDYNDGLQGNYFAAGHRSRPSSCRGRDGILYFGGDQGFNFFDPLQIGASSESAPVVITQFKLFDKLVNGANEAKEITLRYNENYFSFEFASLSFYNPEKNQYAYKLEGVDKDWVYSGSRRYAGYTDIGPGRYTFRVKATNNDRVWNEQGVSVLVIIQPPWWRTWWAYGIYASLFIIAAIGVHRYQKQKVIRVEREKAHKKELAQAKEIEKAYHSLEETHEALKSTQAQLIQSRKDGFSW